MTSCDERLSRYVAVQLQSIADNLPDHLVHFYLFHSRISEKSLEFLESISRFYQNIVFHVVRIPDPEQYNELAKYSRSSQIGGWGGEAYYSFCAWQFLPETLDRILYIDAGDVLITDDISPYYFGDFDNKSLLVTGTVYKIQDGLPALLDSDDLLTPPLFKAVCRGLFNSGSYMLNLEKMRRDAVCIQQFIEFSKTLYQINNDSNYVYFGDQGLLSAVYLGDIRYFGYPETTDIWTMPYNFCMWYFDQKREKPAYKPRILHYAAVPFKPWYGKYPIYLETFQEYHDNLRSLSELKLGQAEYFYQWHEYAVRADYLLHSIEN